MKVRADDRDDWCLNDRLLLQVLSQIPRPISPFDGCVITLSGYHEVDMDKIQDTRYIVITLSGCHEVDKDKYSGVVLSYMFWPITDWLLKTNEDV